MSKKYYQFRVGQRDIEFIKYLKDYQKGIDKVINFLKIINPIAISYVSGAQLGYKKAIIEADNKEIKHACFLLDNDIFEYTNIGFRRYKNTGRSSSFDWDALGNTYNGTTSVTPDQLEEIILKCGEWTKEKYNFTSHNCHDFIQFCMKEAGCPESMLVKDGPCYTSKKNSNNK